jgi:hypothetical protein
MYILLSSGAQKRYRDNVAACLAAPIGGTIQFRYNLGIVEPGVRTSVNAETGRLAAEGKQALVCYIDIGTKSESGEHPIVPVRMVRLSQISTVGSIVVVDLAIEGVGFAENPRDFQGEIHRYHQAPLDSAVNAESARSGCWFFEMKDELKFVRSSTKLADWEQVGEQLATTEGFANVGFFWTVLGIHKGSAKDGPSEPSFSEWPSSLKMDTTYTLSIYLARPGNRDPSSVRSKTAWMGQLLVRTEPSHNSLSRDEIVIDSPYDLKRWSFQIKRPSLTFHDPGWLRIGEEVLDESSLNQQDGGARSTDQKRRELQTSLKGIADWELDLPLSFDRPWKKVSIVGGLLGVLLAVPSLVAIAVPADQTLKQKVGAIVIALAAAIGGSVFAIFQIKKPT